MLHLDMAVSIALVTSYTVNAGTRFKQHSVCCVLHVCIT
jgi:hypothetical protein